MSEIGKVNLFGEEYNIKDDFARTTLNKISDKLKVDVIPHLQNKSNPHNVTPSQIGAIPINGDAVRPMYNNGELALYNDISSLDKVYSPLNHNHDKVYSLLTHNHDGVYSPLNHHHNTAYSPLNHNHDGVYATLNHNHEGTYAPYSHTHNYAGSSSAGGDAKNALKLGGRSLTADGNRWGSVPFVGDDGVMEVGRYIDFHLSDADTGTSGDTTGGRLEADGTNLKFKDKKLATIEGSQTDARTGRIIIGDMAIVFGIVSATSGATAGDGLYTGNATVNYGVTFKNTPVIVPAFSGRLNQMRAVGTSSVTTTSANIWFKATSAKAEMSVQWIAIGQLA